jgi:hypothetical protein
MPADGCATATPVGIILNRKRGTEQPVWPLISTATSFKQLQVWLKITAADDGRIRSDETIVSAKISRAGA